MASQARTEADAANGLVGRVLRSQRPTNRRHDHVALAFGDGFLTNLMEETREPLEVPNGSVGLDVSGYQIATVGATANDRRRRTIGAGFPWSDCRARPARVLCLLAAQQRCRPARLPTGHGADPARRRSWRTDPLR